MEVDILAQSLDNCTIHMYALYAQELDFHYGQ